MASDDNLIPVIVPSLAQLLALHEEKKGSPLTEDEVRSLRDKAPCIMTPKSFTATQTKTLGFRDVNPENCWADWQRLRVQLTGVGSLPKLVMCVLGDLESKAQFEQILTEDEIQHKFSERDTRMEEAFRAASCGRGSTLTPEDSQAIADHSLLQEALPDSPLIVNEAVYLFNAFCLYLLSECPEGEFAPGHSFQPDLEFPSFRLEWEPCQGYAEDDLSFNPYGRWRFAKLGKNAPNRGK
jgi:hypothetical protein